MPPAWRLWDSLLLLALFAGLAAGAATAGSRPIAPFARGWHRPPAVDAAARAPAGRTTDERQRLAALVSAVIARDPFRTRGMLAGAAPPRSGPVPLETDAEPRAEPEVVTPLREPVPSLRVLGLVVLGDGRGMAALEAQGAPSKLVSVGDEFAGFRLRSVSATEARLERRDTSLVLRLQTPSAP